ncbi:MAG: hypothetical protein ABJ081_01165 [Hyphomicrobiales bacterium]
MSNRTEKHPTLIKPSLLSAIVMVFMVFIMTSVSTDIAEAKDIWRTKNGAVILIKTDKGAVNQHPKVFGPRDIYFALRAIKVRKKSGVLSGLTLGVLEKARRVGNNNRTASLFTDSEARTLTTHILEGFRQANSNQDVSFSLRQSRGNIGGALLSSADVVTSGRVFFAGNRLNIIFGTALNDAALKTGALDRDARRFGLIGGKIFEQATPGSRRTESRLGVDIATGNGIALSTFNGKKREDWVQVVSLSEIARSVSSQAQQQRSGGGQVQQAAPARSQLSVEQRLAKLKKLRDQGLISNDIYKEQTLKVLDSSL